MKRLFSILLFLLLVFSASCPVFAEGTFVPAKQIESSLKNPIANVELFTESERIASDVVLLSAKDTADLAATLSACLQKNAVPTVRVDTVEEADALLSALQSTEIRDVTAVSANAQTLSHLRRNHASIRLGFLVTRESEDRELTAEYVQKTVGPTPATFCVLPVEDASRALIRELQSLLYHVWVQVTDAAGTQAFTVNVVRALTACANGLVTESATAVQEVIHTHFAKNTMSIMPYVAAHRGDLTSGPENSLAGILGAHKNGADFAEVDLALTSDGEVVLLHDHTLNRTTNYKGSKTVSEMTLSEVRTFRLLNSDGAVSEHCVPTLREALEAIRDKDIKLLLEIKTKTCDSRIPAADLVKEMGMEDRVCFISYTAEYLNDVHDRLPTVSTSLILAGANNKTPEGLLKPLEDVLEKAAECESTYSLQYDGFSYHFEQATLNRGVPLWVYTLNGSNNRLFWGAPDGLTTDVLNYYTDMARTLTADTLVTVDEDGYEIRATLETYGGKTTSLTEKDLQITVLSGEENLQIEDGVAFLKKGAKEGATLLIGCAASIPDGHEYVLYAEVMTLTLPTHFPLVAVLIGTPAVLIFGAGITVFLLVSKKRKQK